MNGLPPASHSQPTHKMYTVGSLELHRGVEIQLCNTHKHRNIYQLCAKLLSCGLNGCDTFIGLLSLARNHNATLTAVDHWDAYLGLRLTRKGLAIHLHPALKEEGLRPSISFTAIFTALSLKCGSLASLNFEKILSQNLSCLSRIIFVNLPNFLYF